MSDRLKVTRPEAVLLGVALTVFGVGSAAIVVGVVLLLGSDVDRVLPGLLVSMSGFGLVRSSSWPLNRALATALPRWETERGPA